MLQYVLRRLAYGALVLVLVVLTISSIIYLAPVDPARLTFGQRSDAASIEAKQKQLGLDQSLAVQLLYYLRDLSPVARYPNDQLEVLPSYSVIQEGPKKSWILKWPYLRESYQSGRPVIELIREAVPLTLALAIGAILLAALIGIPLGILAALNQNSWVDYLAVTSSVVGISVPSYVSAMLLALVFGYAFYDWTGLEVQGSLIELDDWGETVIRWENLILPTIALGIRPVAIVTQLTRSAMLDVLSQDFVRTAKAKGLKTSQVVFKHALRNALNPVITALSGWFAALLAGAFFVENVFNYHGLGYLTVQALLQFDIPVVTGAVLCTAGFFVLVNILLDVSYAYLDPRVKLK